MRLAGRVAIVTGDVEGLGRAFALTLAREGARIIVAEPRHSRSDAIAAEVRATGGEATSISTDVTDEASVRALIRATLARHGRLDILVNKPASALAQQGGPFDEIPREEWDAQITANVHGTFLCCKAVAPTMRAQRGGKIINVVSAAFDLGEPNRLPLVASMGAIVGITRGIASELGGFGVNVNALAHGPLQELHPLAGAIPHGQALDQPLRPDDLLGTLLFLASSDSDFMTGQTLRVDGGLRYH